MKARDSELTVSRPMLRGRKGEDRTTSSNALEHEPTAASKKSRAFSTRIPEEILRSTTR